MPPCSIDQSNPVCVQFYRELLESRHWGLVGEYVAISFIDCCIHLALAKLPRPYLWAYSKFTEKFLLLYNPGHQSKGMSLGHYTAQLEATQNSHKSQNDYCWTSQTFPVSTADLFKVVCWSHGLLLKASVWIFSTVLRNINETWKRQLSISPETRSPQMAKRQEAAKEQRQLVLRIGIRRAV